MYRHSYLAVCICAASLGVAPSALAADAAHVEQTDKLTIVGSDGLADAPALIKPASVAKSGAPVKELPYSVSVIDTEFAIETGAKSVQDALLYNAGVYAGGFGIDTRVDSSKIRGADPIKYVDGLRSHYGSYNNVRPNLFAMERVEVLKGPASVLYGQGSVGGVVNTITKRPQAEQAGEFWAQAGSFERKQLAADWTGALDAEERVLVRMIGLMRDSGTQVDHVDDDEILINPSLTWRISDATDLTLIYNYQKREGGITAQFLPTQGTLQPGPLGYLPTSTFIGEPGWDRYDREQNAVTIDLQHEFNDSWKLAAIARHVDAETETREHWANIGVAPAADGTIGRTIYQGDRSTEGLNLDLRLQGQVVVGETEHRLLFGIDRQDVRTDEGNFYRGAGTPINAYNPTYGSLAVIPSTIDRPFVDTEQLGFYASDHINWGAWVLSAALRHDTVKTTLEGSDTAESSATTGHLGVMYQLENGLSPYVSYSESFEANTGSDGLGGTLDPTEGEQVEVGIKYLSADERTMVTLSRFDIEQKNRVISGNIPGGFQQTAATIDGWELEAQQKWDQLDLRVNLSALDARDGAGNRLPYLAEHQASFWGTYKIDNHWRVGLGVRRTGANVGWGGAPVVDGVTLSDAMIGYDIENWRFSLDVKNLADKRYIAWCRSNGTDCGFGERLNATLNARYSF